MQIAGVESISWLADRLDCLQIDTALKVLVHATNDEDEMVREAAINAMVALLGKLDIKQLGVAFKAAMQAASDEIYDVKLAAIEALPEFAALLDHHQLDVMLAVAFAAADNDHDWKTAGFNVIAAIGTKLDGQLLDEALMRAIHAACHYYDESLVQIAGLDALAALVPNLQGPQVGTALTAAIKLTSGKNTRTRTRGLDIIAALVPKLDDPQLRTALKEAANAAGVRDKLVRLVANNTLLRIASQSTASLLANPSYWNV